MCHFSAKNTYVPAMLFRSQSPTRCFDSTARTSELRRAPDFAFGKLSFQSQHLNDTKN